MKPLMGESIENLKIPDVVIELIAVLVVDLHSFGDGPMLSLPD